MTERKLITDLFVELARNGFAQAGSNDLCGLAEGEWKELLALARSTKVFPLFVKSIMPAVPQSLLPLYEQHYAMHLERLEIQKSEISRIAKASEQENLRFVLFKGVALSYLVYGDYEARQTGDIDILVDENDLSRVDFVMRSCGFYQPDWTIGESLGETSSSRKAAQYLQFRENKSAPYPCRRRAHDTQLAPYYSPETGIKVEVHDSLRCIGHSYVKSMLWKTSLLEIGGRIRTFDNEHTFLYLLITAYDNSENFYACLDGELNLRDYVDIYWCIHNPRTIIDWSKVASLVEQLSLEKMVSIVYSNYQDVFGTKERTLEPLSGNKTELSVYQGSNYLKRLFEPERCEHLAIQQKRNECRAIIKNGNAQKVAEGAPVTWQRYENPYAIDISYGLWLQDDSLMLVWRVPIGIQDDLPLIGLQVAFVPSYDAEYLAYLVCISHEQQGLPAASIRHTNRLVQRFKLAAHRATLECQQYNEGEFCLEEVKVPLNLLGYDVADAASGIGVLPVVFRLATKNAYHSICAAEQEFSSINTAFCLEWNHECKQSN